MKRTAKILLTVAAGLTTIAGALCLVGVFWDKLVALCPCCGLKEKLPTKEQLMHKIPWKRCTIEDEFADYDDC